MSIIDCVMRHTFTVSFTADIDESENRLSGGGLEHDRETPRPSTFADITDDAVPSLEDENLRSIQT